MFEIRHPNRKASSRKSVISRQSIGAKAPEDIPIKTIDEVELENKYKALLESINLEGNYQKLQFLVMFLISLSASVMIFTLPLQGRLPTYECFSIENFKDYEMYLNDDKRYRVVENHMCVKEYCLPIMPESVDGNDLILVYDNYSVINWVTQLHVVCTHISFFNAVGSYNFVGKIIIPTILAYLADKIGRLKVFRINNTALILSFIFYYFYLSKTTAMIISFLVMGLYYELLLGYLMLPEYMTVPLGKNLVIFGMASYSFAGIIYTFVMYIFRDITIINLFVFIVFLVLEVIAFTFSIEPPKFLLHTKRYEEFEKATLIIAKFNNREAEYSCALERLDDYRNLTKSNKINISEMNIHTHLLVNEKKISFIQDLLGPYFILFGSKLILIIVLKLCIVFLAMNILVFGFMLSVQQMKGDPYVNLMVYFIADMIAKLCGGFILKVVRTIDFLLVLFILSFIFNIGLIYFSQIELVRMALIFGTCFTYSITFIVCFAYVTEIFDPSVKATAFIFLMGVGTMGLVFYGQMVEIFPTPFHLFTVVSFFPIIICYSLLDMVE